MVKRKELIGMKKRNASKKMILKSLIALSGLSLIGNNATVNASNWTANTPDQIKIEQGATEYAMKLGDTIWAIGQAINVKTDVLLEVNGLNYETARLIPVGRVIKLVASEGDKVSVEVTDSKGNVVGSKELTNADKVDQNKDFGTNVQTGDKTLVITERPDNTQTEKPIPQPQPEETTVAPDTTSEETTIAPTPQPETPAPTPTPEETTEAPAPQPQPEETTEAPAPVDNYAGIVPREDLVYAGATLGTITGDYEYDGDLGAFADKQAGNASAETALHSDHLWDNFPEVMGWEAWTNADGTWQYHFYK